MSATSSPVDGAAGQAGDQGRGRCQALARPGGRLHGRRGRDRLHALPDAVLAARLPGGLVLAFLASRPDRPYVALGQIASARRVGLALGYLGLAAVLRMRPEGVPRVSAVCSCSRCSGWGFDGGGIELTAVVLGLFLVQLVPLTTIGGPAYPASGWWAVVLTSVAAIAGAMVLRLVGDARRRAEDPAAAGHLPRRGDGETCRAERAAARGSTA